MYLHKFVLSRAVRECNVQVECSSYYLSSLFNIPQLVTGLSLETRFWSILQHWLVRFEWNLFQVSLIFSVLMIYWIWVTTDPKISG